MVSYRADIDGLRAVAVILVVAFHAFPHMAPGGFIGVDIFFVISGYLISSIILKNVSDGSFSFRDFYSRRIKRIFPALILVLAFVFSAGWFLLLPSEYKQLGKHLVAGAGFASNFVLWNESGYFDATAEGKPLLHLWSLGIEEQFYILWPLVMYLANRAKSNLVVPLILGVLALSFLLNIYYVRDHPEAVFYAPLTRFWELMLGCLLAWRSNQDSVRPKSIAWNNLQAAAGAVLLLASLALIDKQSFFPGWLALLPTASACLLISAGGDAWINRRLLSAKAVVWIGLISYPLYLWHWPILTFLRVVETNEPSPFQYLAAISISIVLAWITYALVEKPMRFGKWNTRKVLGLCLSMCTVASVGLSAYANDGFSSRYSSEIRGLADFKYDPSIPYRTGSCFLKADQSVTSFAPCIEPSLPRAPTLYLWGDSYAAHLYLGLKHEFGQAENIIQLTSVGCPPVYGVVWTPRCDAINAFVLRQIAKDVPHRVILGARWSGHGWAKIAGGVSAAIVELRKLGVKRIDLVGQMPEWSDTLPTTLYKAYEMDEAHKIPQRMTFGLAGGGEVFDAELREFSRKNSINYISPRDILCNQEGCLTMVGGRLDSLISFDRGHLTVPASVYMISRFPQ